MISSDANSTVSGPWRRLGVMAVIMAAAAAWLAVQPASQLKPHDPGCRLSALVYDPFDHAAMSLRGLNAVRGRMPGRLDAPVEPWNQEGGERRPLADRYFLEYPHAALLLFRMGWLLQPQRADHPLTEPILDADYHDLAEREPVDAHESELLRGFVVSARWHVAVMALGWLALAAVLEWGYGPTTGLRGGAWLLALPAALYFTLNRYDVIPVLCTAISFACLGRRRIAASAVAMALGVLFKAYPILFAPLVLRYLWTDRREAAAWLGAFVGTGLLAFTPLAFGADLRAVWAPYVYQLIRPPVPAMTIYGFLLPPSVASGPAGSAIRLGALGIVATLMLIRPIVSLAGLLRRCAIVLLVVSALAAFYSPQWILWFAPLVLPLISSSRRVGWTFAVLDVGTYLMFPVWFWLAGPLGELVLPYPEWMRYFVGVTGGVLRAVRFGVGAVLAWQLITAEWPSLWEKTWLGRHLRRAFRVS